MFDLSPTWASKHNYHHHSAPNEPDFHAIYRKAWVRPRINKSWEILKDPNSSNEEREEAEDIINMYEFKKVVMSCGQGVQAYCDAMLLDQHTHNEAFAHGLSIVQEYQPPKWKDGSLDTVEIVARTETIRLTEEGAAPTKNKPATKTEFELVCENALEGLRQASASLEKLEGEKEYTKKLDGCELPYLGIPDYSGCIELKTKWDGLKFEEKELVQARAASLPKEISTPWLKQVTGYWALTGKIPTIVAANRKDFKIYTPTEESLRLCLAEIESACRRRERILKQSDNVKELLGNLDPAWSEQRIWSGKSPQVFREVERLSQL